MIQALIEYKVNPYVINIIAKLYSEDRTVLMLGEMEKEIGVNSGIKQGCPISTTLFKLVTFMIIQELEEKGAEYMVDGKNTNSIFFADDGILFAKSRRDTERNLKLVIEISAKYGLHINKDKGKILVYGKREEYDEIEGIEVVETIKYLGLMIDNTRDIYKTQKELIISKTKTYENLTHSVIS